MIELTIIGPTSQRMINVQWIRVETTIGNLIIQPGHAPAIMILRPFKNIELGLSNGLHEQVELRGGILRVDRKKATIIVNE